MISTHAKINFGEIISMRKGILKNLYISLLISLLLGGCAQSAAASKEDAACSGFETKKAEGDISFDYHLFTPEDGTDKPLVIVFHGYGENEIAQNTKIVTTITSEESQALRPCYLIAPAIEDNIFLAKSNRDSMYSKLKEISDKLISDGKVDPDRIYVLGNSFGGLATIEFLEAYPEDIAGAICMCPALTYSKDSTSDLSKIKDIPLWFAHAENDNVIPVTVSKSAYSTLKAMGSENVYLTTFSNEEMLKCGALTGYHQSDLAVMADDSFLEWLFENKN
ncbi:MAG: hypothetical protein E7303_08110 [Butyrivibrio sp.]|nr:hypothetical protein [Butyrivibrio sp.]